MPTFKEVVATHSPKELAAVRTIFDVFDHNKDGFISFKEFVKTMDLLEQDQELKSSKRLLKRMFQDADKDRDKKISWEEFIEASSTPYEDLKRQLKAVSTRPPVSDYHKMSGDEALLKLQ